MIRSTLIAVPSLVRIKPGALSRLGIYARRLQASEVVLLVSEGLPALIVDAANESVERAGVRVVRTEVVATARYEDATALAPRLGPCDAVIGLGGGRALDVAKYVAHLAAVSCVTVPTSLSNDGFASPHASLTVDGKRRSFAGSLPRAVVLDTAVCHGAPRALWLSGISDVAGKVTAVVD